MVFYNYSLLLVRLSCQIIQRIESIWNGRVENRSVIPEVLRKLYLPVGKIHYIRKSMTVWLISLPLIPFFLTVCPLTSYVFTMYVATICINCLGVC